MQFKQVQSKVDAFDKFNKISIPIRDFELSIIFAPTKLHSERRSKTDPANDSAVIRRGNGWLQ